MIDVNEGITNNYLVPTIFGTLLCLPIVIYSPLIGLPLLILCLAWFAATNGLEVSPENKSYRKYAGYLWMKVGVWKQFDTPISAKLILSTENAQFLRGMQPGYFPIAGSFYGRAGQTKTLTYDVLLTDVSGKNHFLYDFLSYKNARKVLLAVEK